MVTQCTFQDGSLLGSQSVETTTDLGLKRPETESSGPYSVPSAAR